MRIPLRSALVLAFLGTLALAPRVAAQQRPAPAGVVPATYPVEDPWAALELTDQRLRDLGGRAPGARPDGLPAGEIELDGVPLRFARAGEAWDLAARGQRISFAPKEGGRYYDLYLAAAFAGEAPARLELELVGSEGRVRRVPLACAPRDPQQPFVVQRVPLASEWPLEALRLPADERLHVYAAALHWRPSGPEERDFRRALLANELDDKDLRRYLRNLEQGGLFEDLATEAPYERAMFDHLVAGRSAAALRLVGARLATLEPKTAAAKRARVHVCLVVPPRGGGARVEELRTLVWVLDGDAELCGAVGGVELLRELERVDPPAFARLDALVRAGRLEIAGFQERLDWNTPPDERALAAAFAQGEEYAREHGWNAARPGLLGDPAAQPLLPAWCARAKQFRVVQWSESSGPAPVPPAFAWRAEQGPALLCLHLPAPVTDLADERWTAGLERAREALGTAELLLPLALGADREAARATLARLRELAQFELGPSFLSSTPTRFLESLRADGKWKPAPWQPRPAIDLGGERAAPLALRSATRRAEAELEACARVAALAQLDGLVFLRADFLALEAVLAAVRAAGPDASAAAPRAAAQAARRRAQESLRVLARSARSAGEGSPIVVFNPLPFERSAIVELDGPVERVLDPEGKPAAWQETADGRHVLLARLPAFGHAVFRQLASASRSAALTPAAKRSEWSFESSRLALRLDPATGDLLSLRVMPEGIELLGQRSNTLVWMPAGAGAAPRALREVSAMEVLEDGPVRLVVRIERRLDEALVVQDLILERDRPELLVRVRSEGLDSAGTLAAGFHLPRENTTLHYDACGAPATLDPAGRDARAFLGARRYVSLSNGELGLALLSADSARFAVAGARIYLEIAEGGPEAGCECAFALRPFLESAGAGVLAAAADELVFPAYSEPADSHVGARPARHSYLELARRFSDGSSAHGARAGAELVALRPVAGGFELTLRERLGAEGTLELEFDRSLFAAERADGTRLEAERTRLALPLAPWQGETLRLRLRP